jgi:hypothetical protein
LACGGRCVDSRSVRRQCANRSRRDLRANWPLDSFSDRNRSRSGDQSWDHDPARHFHAVSVGFDAFLLVLAAGPAIAVAAELSIDAADLPIERARWRRRDVGFAFRNDLAAADLFLGIANRRRAFDAIPSIRLSSVVKEQLCFLSVFELAGRFVRASTSKGDLVMHLKSVILGSAVAFALSAAAYAQPQTNMPPSTSPSPSAATQPAPADQGTATQPAGTDMATGAKAAHHRMHHRAHHAMHHAMHHATHHAAKASSAAESSEEATTAQLNQQQAANPGSTPAAGGSSMGGSGMSGDQMNAPQGNPPGNSNTSTPAGDNSTPPKNSDVPDNSKDNTGNPH